MWGILWILIKIIFWVLVLAGIVISINMNSNFKENREKLKASTYAEITAKEV